MKTLVRSIDNYVFEVDEKTLDARSCSIYDPWCYKDPEPDVRYIEYSTWAMRNYIVEYMN